MRWRSHAALVGAVGPWHTGPIIPHFDGVSWTAVTGLPQMVWLRGVVRVPGTDTLWTVGSLQNADTGVLTAFAMVGP